MRRSNTKYDELIARIKRRLSDERYKLMHQAEYIIFEEACFVRYTTMLISSRSTRSWRGSGLRRLDSSTSYSGVKE